MSILDELKSRKILNNISNESLFNNLKEKKVYIGFDPTSKSLHLGNYIQISILKRFQNYGYEVFALIGGATGYIGDPSGKNSERILLTKSEIDNNTLHIKKQLESFGFKVINNNDWYKDLSMINFLRDIGKLLNINYMLAKDSVKSRLDVGISFTEFSYQLLQAWDFYKLNTEKKVSIQVGGSDQWGNITAGLEIIRKMNNNDAVGITTNLLLNSNGKKFGKSEGGAIFLDPNITSPYLMHQYFYNQPDSSVQELLYWFSFDSLEEINKIIATHNKDPKKRIAQEYLANTIISNIHDNKYLDIINSIRHNLFFHPDKLTKDDFKHLEQTLPSANISIDENILEILFKLNIITSKRMGRNLIENGSIKVDGIKVENENYKINFSKHFHKYAILEKGKKYRFLIIKDN